jgi:hypothetical protein
VKCVISSSSSKRMMLNNIYIFLMLLGVPGWKAVVSAWFKTSSDVMSVSHTVKRKIKYRCTTDACTICVPWTIITKTIFFQRFTRRSCCQ